MTQQLPWLFLASRSSWPFFEVRIQSRYSANQRFDFGCAFEHAAVGQHRRRASGLDQMQGVDDSGAAPFVQIEDRLRVFEVRVHLRRGIDEPRAQMLAGVIGVLLFSGQLPCRCKRRNDEAQPHHGLAVVVEVGGIGESVATYVGAVGILFIGPPVVALGEVVVRAALASFAVRGGDGDRLLGEISVRGGENSRAVGRRDEIIGVDRSVGLGLRPRQLPSVK